MLLVDDTRLSAFDKQTWLITAPSGQYVRVNADAAELYRILLQSPTIEQALERFNQTFQIAFDIEQFTRLITGRFGGCSLLRDEPVPPVDARSLLDHIALQIPLLSSTAAGLLAIPLRPLYRPAVFWPLVAAQIGLLGGILLKSTPIRGAGIAEYAVAIPLLYGSVLLHEVGHIAACARLGIRHGGIGFGFYAYVFPVLFADITGIWEASRHQRMIANLGGIVAQLLLATGLALAYLATDSHALLLASTTITVSAIWQFNPFVRRDGYWMLADLTNHPNLLLSATQVVREAFTRASALRVLTSRGKVLLRPKMALLLYGLGNSFFFVLLLSLTLFHHGEAILRLPAQVPTLLMGLLQGTAAISEQQLIAAAFYLVWGRLLASYLLRRRAAANTLTPPILAE